MEIRKDVAAVGVCFFLIALFFHLSALQNDSFSAQFAGDMFAFLGSVTLVVLWLLRKEGDEETEEDERLKGEAEEDREEERGESSPEEQEENEEEKEEEAILEARQHP
jgi:hypothetical protein